MAAQRVFDIAELLEIIICQVDAHHIRDLKLVDRSWHDAIVTSRAIRRSRIVNSYHNMAYSGLIKEPLTKSQDEHSEAFMDAMTEPLVIIARYDWNDWIRVTPALSRVHCLRLETRFELTIRLPTTAEATSTSIDKFVADPPIQHLTLMLVGWHKEQWAVCDPTVACSLFNAKGLKIRHILSARDEVLRGLEDGGVGEVVATLLIHSRTPKIKSIEDERVRASYSEGPLPRYRKSTHRLNKEGIEAHRKDEELFREPSMDEALGG